MKAELKVGFIAMILVCGLLSIRNLYAIGEAGAQFLKIGIGTKACALGEAFTAVADDPTAIYWNPAGLTQINSAAVLAMQNFWLVDMSNQYLSGVIPTRYGSFGASVSYSSSGDIPRYEDFVKVGEYTAYDIAGTIGYANSYKHIFSAGMSLKYIRMKIEEESAVGWAIDGGLLFSPDVIRGLRIGVSVLNIGPGIKFIEKEDPLPLNTRFGASYQIGPILITSDINKLRDNDWKFNFGAAYKIHSSLELYGGYNTYDENESISGGASIFIKRIGIGYAFVSYRDLDNSHRISASLGL
jgi:hypothetical protein